MAIIKLKQGDRVPFIVTGVQRDVPATNPRYGPSTKFVGRTPTDPDACVFMNPATAERQLTRLGLDLDTVIGKPIEFARPGEYVDINHYTTDAQPALSPALAPAPTAPAPAAKPSNAKAPHSAGPHIEGLDDPIAPAPDTRLEAVFRLYEVCFARSIAIAQRTLANTGVPTSHEGLVAMTATTFIEASHKGIVG